MAHNRHARLWPRSLSPAFLAFDTRLWNVGGQFSERRNSPIADHDGASGRFNKDLLTAKDSSEPRELATVERLTWWPGPAAPLHTRSGWRIFHPVLRDAAR